MTKQSVSCVDVDGNFHEVSLDQLRWRPSVYAIIIKDNSLLVSPQFNGYGLPGGGVELGEMPEEALIREVKEETGIIAANPRLLACKSNFFRLTSEKRADIQSLLFYYVCDTVGGKLSDHGFTDDDKKFSGFPEWIPLDKLDITLSSGRLASSFDWRPLVKEVAKSL